MSMFVLNSALNERYPTVIDGLIYTYPFDGEMHCCVNNLKYAKVLIINNGSDELYKIFQSKGSLITSVILDTSIDEVQINEGQYNLIAIDSSGKEIPEDTIKKIKELSNAVKTSVIIHSLNKMDISYNYGGSYVYISPIIKERVIYDAVTKGSLYNSIYNTTLIDDCIILNNGYISIPWDNRLDNFSICFNLEIDNCQNNIDLISIKNNSNLLIDIYFDLSQNIFKIKSNNDAIIEYSISSIVNLTDSINKITVTKHDYNVKIYCNDSICVSANVETSTKGNTLIIGESSLSEINDLSVIRINELSIYDRVLSFKDIEILNKGRLIFT